MIFKIKALILSMIMAVFLISSVEAAAPKKHKKCKKLTTQNACSKRKDCRWISAHKKKDGTAVKAHCKKKAKKTATGK